jgi:peptide/nickel transport system substrate-binding protein
VLVLALAACTSKSDGQNGNSQKGGILRVQTKTFRWSDALDPSGEYLGYAWGVFNNMLIRSLLGYRHVPGDAGNQTVPDLATDNGTISPDGLTWSFTLKKGVKYSPPINREVKASDITYSFERIAKPSVGAQYAFYYTDNIVGMKDFADGKATSISGITADDAAGTIAFKLTKPTGDFNFRLAMPAAAPIPPEVGHCFEQRGQYGRYIISNGPYMLSGIDKIDPTSCATLKSTPASGFDPSASGHLFIVRNPNYDAATDSKELRENLIDGYSLTANSNPDDIFNKIEAGEVDAEAAKEPPQILAKADTDLKGQIHSNSGDRTWYFSMNLDEPPFDDVHVRKALNFAIDRDALLRLAGGKITGAVAQHVFPPQMLGGRLPDYAPYPTNGDLTKAKQEMKLSKYDSNQDGVCDAKACKNVVAITEDAPPFSDYAAPVKEAGKGIGVDFTVRNVADSYTFAQEVKHRVVFFMGGGWGKDYPDIWTYAQPLFEGNAIAPGGANNNFSLTGLTKAQANKFGIPYVSGGVPSVDADIEACGKLQGDARLDCWANLDKKLTEEVVSWVPYRFANAVDTVSKAVTTYQFDQSVGEMAFAHLAIDPSKQTGNKNPISGGGTTPTAATSTAVVSTPPETSASGSPS